MRLGLGVGIGMGGGTPPLWTPAALSATKLILRADTATPTLWNDLSGNGNNGTDPISPTARPTINATYYNNHSAVVFDGSNDHYLNAIALAGGAKAIAFSFKLAAIPGTDSFFTPFRFKNSTLHAEALIFNAATYRSLSAIFDVTTAGANSVGATIPLDTNPHTAIISWTGAFISRPNEYLIWIDGSAHTVRSSGFMFPGATTVGSIGARANAAGFEGFDMNGGMFRMHARSAVNAHADAWRLHDWLSRGWTSSPTWTPQVVCDGNSLTYGFGSALLDAVTGGNFNSYPHQMATVTLGGFGAWNVVNLGVNGQTTQNMIDDFATQVAPIYNARRSKNIYVPHEVGNEINNGVSARTAVDRYWTLCDMARAVGFKVIAVVPQARGFAGDAGKQAVLASARTFIRNEYAAHADRIADLFADTRLDDFTDATYYVVAGGDDTHNTAAGYGACAEVIGAQVLLA